MSESIQLLHILSQGQGEPDKIVSAFADELRPICTLPELLLVDGRAALPPHEVIGERPTVLLNADRGEVIDLLERYPLAAAIERYALYSWWRYRGRRRGAFWLHGSLHIARALGPDVIVGGLFQTENHCAFGSTETDELPALLVRYLAAAASHAHT
jgi:hypothetical protein